MSERWSEILAACASTLHGSALGEWIPLSHPVGMLLLGLVGGAVHCSGMCGPFVLGQVGAHLSTMPATQASTFTRLRGMALLPYHAGRATTYSLLGAAAAGMAGGVQRLTAGGYLPAFALLAGAALVIALVTRQSMAASAYAGHATGFQQWWLERLRPAFRQPTGLYGYGLGLALGFLPCGLLYSALVMAGAAGSWQAGAIGMAAFALGTFPALMIVGFLGAAAGQRWRRMVRFLFIPVIILNIGMLLALALRWVA